MSTLEEMERAQRNGRRVRPFSNGSEHMDWQENNCLRCTKNWQEDSGEPLGPCVIENEINVDGMAWSSIKISIAKRAGWDGHELAWDCPERELAE